MDDSLNSSILGTLKYWDDTYRTELENFSGHGDVGEVWFGEVIAKRIIKWVVGNPIIRKDSNIIDIGCGNGMLLIELFKKGFDALHGIDYSANAIELATKISKKDCCNIKFSVSNILEDSFPSIYSIALDKGTFDAISLDPDDSKRKREIYIRNVWNLLITDGMLLITSCNWTEEELKNQFACCFSYLETLPTPCYTFGGRKGNTVTSVVFKKLCSTKTSSLNNETVKN